MDRISNLPDEILCHIGSFLSAKDAAFTKVLSKRWRNLLTIIQALYFHSMSNCGEGFKDFVDGVLALPASSRINKFSILWEYVDIDQYVHINRCLCDVVKRGVLVLALKIREKEGYSLPLEVFTCKTVEKLTLGSGFTIDILPNDASLPALKTLFLDSVRFSEFGGRCAFTALLSASPLLEELVMDNIELRRWKWSCIVSSPTLRRLTIRLDKWLTHDDFIAYCRGLAYDFDSISLDLPGLTYLEYSDYVPKEYLIVNLNSLIEAKLDLCVDEDGVWNERHADDFNPMNLINGIKNVEILDISLKTMMMLHVFLEGIPVFEKLSRVSVSPSEFCWSPLARLIKNSPNLKTLIIKGHLHCGLQVNEWVCKCVSEYSFLVSCPLEVVQITNYSGSIRELEQMKHFFGKLSCLKLVRLCAYVSSSNEKRVMEDLLKLPKASSNCKIQVKFIKLESYFNT